MAEGWADQIVPYRFRITMPRRPIPLHYYRPPEPPGEDGWARSTYDAALARHRRRLLKGCSFAYGGVLTAELTPRLLVVTGEVPDANARSRWMFSPWHSAATTAVHHADCVAVWCAKTIFNLDEPPPTTRITVSPSR